MQEFYVMLTPNCAMCVEGEYYTSGGGGGGGCVCVIIIIILLLAIVCVQEGPCWLVLVWAGVHEWGGVCVYAHTSRHSLGSQG